jgi:hypothetical protein
MDSEITNLYLLANKENLLPEDIRKEVAFLGRILYESGNYYNLAYRNEVIDINRRKIIHKHSLVGQVLEEKRESAFLFIFNKN